MVEVKKELHITRLNTLWKCGEQYRRRYIQGEIIPPGIALLIGSATHQTIESDLKQKIETGLLLPDDVITDMAADKVKGLWQRGVKLEEGESPEKSKGQVVDFAVACSTAHHKVIAPVIKPISVEDEFKFTIEDSDWTVAGTSDIEEELPDGEIGLRDTKTAARKPAAGVADNSIQLTMYALKILKQKGKYPKQVAIDFLVKNKNADVVTQVSTRSDRHIAPLLAKISAAIKQLDAGIFPPCNQDNWYCSPRWCGYFSTCKYVSK